MANKLKNIIETAMRLAQKAMSQRFRKAKALDLPKTSGVYLIKHGKDGIIYIGKAKNLKRRIGTDHLSAETKDTMSAFRRSVHEQYKQPFGPKMRKWITENCSFSFLEIEDHDIYSLVEAILIAVSRSGNLLNKPRPRRVS